MLKIAFVWPWGGAKHYRPLVKDGLMKAIDIIGEKHQVDWFLEDDVPDNSYDWIMPWGVASIPFNNTIQNYRGKKALFCAGHVNDTGNLKKFDVVFVESPKALTELRPHCWRCELAFGVDTDFYKPMDIPKHIDALYPACFSTWKRQGLFGYAVKHRGLAFGVMQPDGLNEYTACNENGCTALAGLMPTSLMPILYNVARSVVITSWHGSERTALEAMACNTPVVITSDNILTKSLVEGHGIVCDPIPEKIQEAFEEAISKLVNTREYILQNYSAKIYAEKVLKILEE